MVKAKLQQLRLDHVADALKQLEGLERQAVPRDGWLRTVREALGRTLKQQARINRTSDANLFKAERAEVSGGISIRQLRKMAEGLDCELVYGLIPRTPLQEVIDAKAEQLARDEMNAIVHTMALEDQRPTDEFVERQVIERKRELLAKNWSRLWR